MLIKLGAVEIYSSLTLTFVACLLEGDFGSLRANMVGLFLTVMVPLCCSTIFLQVAGPSPVPVCFVVNKGSNIFGRISF